MTDEPKDHSPEAAPDEIRLTAYLLDELDGEEKAEVEARLERDPAFAAKRDELEQAAELMREASAIGFSFEDEDIEPFQLSKERRESIFKEKPVKRSRLLTFDFNHPIIPVAVAASFFLILFSDRITVFRDGFVADSALESSQVHYNVQTAPPPMEEGEREIMEAHNFVDFQKRESLEEALGSGGVRSNLEERLDDASKNLGAEGVATFPGEKMSEARVEANKRRLSNTRYFEDAGSPGREPDAIAITQLEVALSPGGDEFNFSIDALKQAKNEPPAIKLKTQDGPEIAANLPEMESVPRKRMLRLSDAAQASVVEEDAEVYELSPFSVDSKDDVGYRAANTLSGSRLRSNVWEDVGYKAESVETLPFLHDTTVVTRESMNDSAPGWADGGVAQSREVVSFLDADLSVPAPPPVDARQQAGQVGITVGRIMSREGSGANVDQESVNVVDGLVVSAELPSSLPEIQAPRIEGEPVESKKAESDEAVEPAQSNPALIEYPEYATAEARHSTFSLNVSDVSFRLAQASLDRNQLPVAGTLRTEEFINAFEYGDPEPSMEESVGLSWGRARWPYHHDKDALRLSLKTAAEGRLETQPVNIVLAIDSSGSMSRADRLEIVEAMLESVGQELQESDRVSVIGFSQDARLILDSVAGDSFASLNEVGAQLNPRGGTDLESGLRLAYETALRNYRSEAVNRVILFTDGAANLGNTVAGDLTELVETHRKAGIALDCFGIGFDGHNDAMLERLSRNGDGRYRFLRSAEEARTEFGETLLGSLRPAAYDVKVQVEFNPERVRTYQLLGYQQHQLKSEDFRDNTVDAAEIAAAEAGSVLYLIAVNESGRGDLGVVRVRYRDASSGSYEERSWNLPYSRTVPALEEAPPAMRLAAVAVGFAALLNESPFAEGIAFQSLINLSQDLPDQYPLDPDVGRLPRLLSKAQQLSGRQ